MGYIYCLIKVFDDMKYADEFREGTLFMRQLREYRSIEDSKSNNRKDKLEGVIAQLDHKKSIISIDSALGSFEINQEDMVEPIRIYKTYHDSNYVFCMYSINNKKWEMIEEDSIGDFIDDMRISEEIHSLGGYSVVVTNVKEFINRVENAARKMKINYKRNHVEYKDMESYHGDIKENMIGFVKDNKYIHQNEYRFIFDINKTEKTFKLHVGDLSDITIMVKTEELNNLIGFNF